MGAAPTDPFSLCQPLRFVWIGDHEGSGANVRFVATKVGRQKLEVVVEGASRRIGTAAAEFEVGAVSVTIRRLAAAGKILVGRPASLAADLMPAGGDYILRWEPSTEVHFESNESSSRQTTAVFRKPGRTKVWLSLLEQKGDALETVGESNHLEFDVAPPALAISLSPSRAYVGSAISVEARRWFSNDCRRHRSKSGHRDAG